MNKKTGIEDYPGMDSMGGRSPAAGPIEWRWENCQKVPAHPYTCGWCGNSTSSGEGYKSTEKLTQLLSVQLHIMFIRICTACKRPSIMEMVRDDHGPRDYGRLSSELCYINGVFPRGSRGKPIRGLPADVKKIYMESGWCLANNAPTAAVMLCRKLLMHISVSKGAEQNKKYIEYVDFLQKKSYIPPDVQEWADRVRNIGNEANHELKPVDRKDAEDIFDFMEMLMKFVYEFPHRMKSGKGT